MPNNPYETMYHTLLRASEQALAEIEQANAALLSTPKQTDPALKNIERAAHYLVKGQLDAEQCYIESPEKAQ